MKVISDYQTQARRVQMNKLPEVPAVLEEEYVFDVKKLKMVDAQHAFRFMNPLYSRHTRLLKGLSFLITGGWYVEGPIEFGVFKSMASKLYHRKHVVIVCKGVCIQQELPEDVEDFFYTECPDGLKLNFDTCIIGILAAKKDSDEVLKKRSLVVIKAFLSNFAKCFQRLSRKIKID